MPAGPAKSGEGVLGANTIAPQILADAETKLVHSKHLTYFIVCQPDFCTFHRVLNRFYYCLKIELNLCGAASQQKDKFLCVKLGLS